MRSILISIQPKWCELIANGKKTIEVRKTRPKIETPFKCYIYCTMAKKDPHLYINNGLGREKLGIIDHWCGEKAALNINCHIPKCRYIAYMAEGKVIGEFVCDKVDCHIADDFVGAENLDGTIRTEPIDGDFAYWIPEEKDTCVSYDEILKYGKGKTLFGWHMSDLKIYDNPRELSEFWAYNEELHKRYDSERDFCCYDATNEYGEALTDCGDAYNNILNCYRCWNEWSGWCHRVTRPPQSWCYVEGFQE